MDDSKFYKLYDAIYNIRNPSELTAKEIMRIMDITKHDFWDNVETIYKIIEMHENERKG